MSDLPVLEPPFRPVREARVGGVLLAAGTSSRYGESNKLLEPIDGEPMVRRSARTLLEADLDPVVAVVGYQADRVREALSRLGVRIVENPDFEEGQATSVAAGVSALPDALDAAVFALGDMPWTRSASVRRLVEAYRAEAGTALAAAIDGERGNPVLWDARHLGDLADQSGDVGGRDLLLSIETAALVETGDPGVRRDVDRPADLVDDR